jgi:hypothetical protein
MSSPEIITGAVLVSLNLTNFGLSKKIDAGSAIATHFNAKESFTGSHDSTTRSSKCIIAKNLYDHIAAYQRETRKQHNEYTGGMRWTKNKDIMSTKIFSGGADHMQPYESWRKDREATLDHMAHEFAFQTYPLGKTSAQNDLGSLYNPDDYPSNNEVYDSIGMEVEIDPIPKGSDFRCSLDPVTQQELVKQYDERLEAVQKESVVKLISALSSKLSHITNSIKNDKVIHNSTLNDLYKYADSLPAIDFTNDSTLKDLADRVVNEVTCGGLRNKDLLKDPDAKETVKKSATDIANNLDAYAETL